MEGNAITAVHALDTRTGAEVKIIGTLFADCTGHGWIGGLGDVDGRLQGDTPELPDGVSLVRFADAERDGDRIYAVIRGLGASSDGKGSSVYAPRPEGQATALTRAYNRAGYSPATVELVNALGGGAQAHSDGFEVVGLGWLDGGTVDSGGDHRIAMAAAVAATGALGPVTIEGAAAAAVSWPRFYEALEALWSSQ